MATNLFPLRPVMIRSCAASSGAQNRRKSSSASPNWWAPLFGWSSEPDYIGSEDKANDNVLEKEAIRSEAETKPVRSRFAPGCFTEEKAKQLRMMTSDTSSFHDVMYHSPIATRLASEVKRLSDR
uniref:Uncharacterized protein MANES_14G128700 n=1 Tax=Rhizophora mucronata TaxID=61149 RepID=A0A2P2JWL7_RHIMU